MLALVTGGQGFIGSHLCARLLAAGHRVRVLARPGSDPGNLTGLEVERCLGDLADPGALASAVAGVDWVFHLAGALKGSESHLMEVNREGTARLVAACRGSQPGIRRFVLVSSLAAAGPSPGGDLPLLEEADPKPLTWYGLSKLAGEREVLASPLPSILLRPPVVFGPRDRELLSFFRLAQRGLLPVPGRAQRRYSLLFAPDLAAGILRAAETQAPRGELFHLTGPGAPTWAELGEGIALALGRPGRVLRLPEGLLRAAGRLADLAARAGADPGVFSAQKVREILAPGWVASPGKAERLLGWTAPTPLAEALGRTVEWYRDHGWL